MENVVEPTRKFNVMTNQCETIDVSLVSDVIAKPYGLLGNQSI